MKKLLSTLAAMLFCITLTQAQLVITEIMFNPPEANTDSLEFIEIYNAGSSPVDLNGHAIDFGNARRDTFTSSFILAPGGLMVTAVNDTAVHNQFGMSFYPRQWASSGLNNTSTLVVLRNASGIVDSVRYLSSWEPSANANGSSLILCNPLSNNALAVSWDTSAVNTGNVINGKTLFGSPGVLESCAAPVVLNYPLLSIGVINTSNLTSGVADSVAVRCEIRGVVHSIDFDGNAGYDITLIDYNHNGITVFSTTDKNGYTAPAMGDSLHVKGVVAQFNGLTQFTVDTITLAQSGVNLLSPLTQTAVLTEAVENKLVRVASVTLVDPLQWTGTGGGFSVDVTNGTTTWQVRIDNDCVWFGLPAPIGTLDIIGTVNQFDTLAPLTGGYQIRPRIITDIITQGGVPTVFFTGDTVIVNEAAGTITMTLNILNADANATSVNVNIGAGSTAIAADYNGFTSPTTVTFPANSSAPQTVTINIVNDVLVESTENIIMELSNVTNNGILGADSVYTIIINDNDVAPTPVYNLVITEINYNNPATDSVEFIEIYNNDTAMVNLAGYQLTNGIFFTFPNRILAPGTFVLVCQDSVLFQQRFGISAYRWNVGNSLNNTGEAIVLRNNTGAILDSIFYSSTAPWPTTASGNGPSAQLCDVNSNNNDGSNWGASNNATGAFIGGVQVFATPGAANTYCRPPYPVLPIGVIDNTNANGEPDSLGLSFEIRGVVHCGDFRTGTGLDFYLINSNNEGVKVYSSSDRGYTVEDGDSLHVWGSVSQGNGVTEFLVDSLFYILPGNATVAPMTVTTAITESMEGSIIQLNNVSLVNATQWSNTNPAGFNVDVTNGTTTWQLRIDDAVSYFNQPAPTGTFSVYGFGSQYDQNVPYTTGYQLLACDGAIMVGTELIEAASTVRIYPNPVQDELNISGEALETVIIRNMLGQELSRTNNINSNFSVIATSTFPTGVYNVTIISNGKLSVQQFVKK